MFSLSSYDSISIPLKLAFFGFSPAHYMFPEVGKSDKADDQNDKVFHSPPRKAGLEPELPCLVELPAAQYRKRPGYEMSNRILYWILETIEHYWNLLTVTYN